MTANSESAVDAEALREEVKSKYREVATDPHGTYHFHTGRYLAQRLGYDDGFVNSLPDVAVESFAGVANPFALRTLSKGSALSMSDQERVSTHSSRPIRLAQAEKSSAST